MSMFDEGISVGVQDCLQSMRNAEYQISIFLSFQTVPTTDPVS